MRLPSRYLSLSVALAFGVAGCGPHNFIAPTKATVASSAVPKPPTGVTTALTNELLVPATSLTGKVKLLVDGDTPGIEGASLISNNGGSLISDNGGSLVSNNSAGLVGKTRLVSDNGGGLVSNNSAGLIANNGGGLVGKTRLRVLDAKPPRELLLADAVVAFYDVAGKPLLDAKGKAITTTTDKTGNYTVAASLPAHGVVARVKLWNGGELSALLPKQTVSSASLTQPIDTASSLGASYVLAHYVKGDQGTLDKLPTLEADKLHADLAGAQPLLTTTPTYQAASLATLTDTLRAKAPGVDQRLTEIQALLLGQANLGDGRQATSVAIFNPVGLAVGPTGEIYLGEPTFGRVREVLPDGTISTLADVVRGKAKRNFPALTDLLRGPDGSIYVAADTAVFKISPTGDVTTIAGNGSRDPGPVDVTAVTASVRPGVLALDSDGNLYIGENRDFANSTGIARLLKIGTDGVLHQIPTDAKWTGDSSITGLAVGSDKTIYFQYQNMSPSYTTIYQIKPGGTATPLGNPSRPSGHGLALGGDGTVFFSESNDNDCVIGIEPDGTEGVVAGKGGLPGTQDLVDPGSLAVGPDNTLYIADRSGDRIHALGLDGSWTLRAGATSADQGTGDQRALAFDAPFDAAFDTSGNLFVSENGSGHIERLSGSTVSLFAGKQGGSQGSGVAAGDALLQYPTGITWKDGTLYVLQNGRLSAIGPDGVLNNIVGDNVDEPPITSLTAGQRVPAAKFRTNGRGITFGPDGLIYWSSSSSGQVYRLAADNNVELVAGLPKGPKPDFLTLADTTPVPAPNGNFLSPAGLAFDPQGDLLVADTGLMRVAKITGLGTASPTMSIFAGAPLTSFVGAISGGPVPPDGTTALTALLVAPAGLAIDPKGNVYVGELGGVGLPLLFTLTGDQLSQFNVALPSSYARIRKIALDGSVTTVAGPGGKYFTDPTAEDGMILPGGVHFAADGRMVIVDVGANLVRILPAGSF